MLTLRKALLFSVVLTATALLLACLSPAVPETKPDQSEMAPIDKPGSNAIGGTPAAQETDREEATLAPPTEIGYAFGVRQVPKDLAMVEDAINGILIPEIGVRLKLDPIEDGMYNERMQLRMAARETCDIVFTSDWTNDYITNVINGSLYPLDNLLPEHAPGLWASLPPKVWEAVRVQGRIYAVINQQMWPRTWGVHVIDEYATQYGLDLDRIHRFEDMEPFAQAILEGEGGKVTPYCRPSIPYYLQYNGVYGFGARVVIRYDDPTVLNVFETPEWQSLARLNRKWFQAGYVLQEEVPDIDQQIQAKRCAFNSQVEPPGRTADLRSRYGLDWVSKNLTDPLILDTSGIFSSLNAICATTADPVAAVQVLEMINTNREVYRLLALGIEGVHYEYLDKELDVIQLPEGKTDAEIGYAPNRDWQFGNQFLAPYRSMEAALADVWGESRRINESAVPHIALGFNFDRKPVETEIAQVQAVTGEFCDPVITGRVEFEGNYEICLEKVRAAGIDAIRAETQRQFDAWLASK